MEQSRGVLPIPRVMFFALRIGLYRMRLTATVPQSLSRLLLTQSIFLADG